MSETPIGTDDLRQVEYLLKNGRKVAAVKLYRQVTGVDLTDAVTAVDRIKTTLPEGDDGSGPPIQAKAIEPSGCAGAFLVFAFGPAIFWILQQIN